MKIIWRQRGDGKTHGGEVVDQQRTRKTHFAQIIFRGVPFVDEADGLVEELRGVVADSLAEAARHEEREAILLQQDLHDDVASFVYERLRRRPMILPVIVEV